MELIIWKANIKPYSRYCFSPFAQDLILFLKEFQALLKEAYNNQYLVADKEMLPMTHVVTS